MNNFTIAFVLGTRPEILKFSAVIKTANKMGLHTTLIHTGQHYDHNMSEVFFKDLNLPKPNIFIGVGSGDQAYQTGTALIEVEKYFLQNRPDVVAVLGDTNAAVSGALAACKLGIPVAHYEAGARSYDWNMPEEINRRLLDSISRFCFAPTKLCLDRLKYEGREADSTYIGDTLVETALPVSKSLNDPGSLLKGYGARKNQYGLLTIHRAENTNSEERLASIIGALNEINYPILFPVHPRTRKKIEEYSLEKSITNLTLIDPLPYTSFMNLIISSKFIVTDSGGVQQEAAIFGKYFLTVRNNTEWMEKIYLAGNTLVKADKAEIKSKINLILNGDMNKNLKNPFELGASEKSLKILTEAKENGSLSYQSSNFFKKSYDDHLNNN